MQREFESSAVDMVQQHPLQLLLLGCFLHGLRLNLLVLRHQLHLVRIESRSEQCARQ